MKKVVALLLTACLLSCIPMYAYAGEWEEYPPTIEQPPQPDENAILTAGTLEELEVCLEAAESGSTIYITSEIEISGKTLATDKQITLSCIDTYDGVMMRLSGGVILEGFTFSDDCGGDAMIYIVSAEGEVTIRNCDFCYTGNESIRFLDISGGTWGTNVNFLHCNFTGATDSAISAKRNTSLVIDSCTFTNNKSYSQGGAIRTSGELLVMNSTITENFAVAGGGIYSAGKLTLSNCQINDNVITNPTFGSDIFSTGMLSITDEPKEGAGYYDEITGEKMILPLSDYELTEKLIYLTTEQVKDYFAPAPTPTPEATQTPEPTPSPDTGEQIAPTQEPTTSPSDPTSIPSVTPEPTVQPTKEPTLPPYYPPVIIPTKKPTETPAPTIVPTQKPQFSTPTPEPTERPQEPVDDGNSEVIPTATPMPTQQSTTPVAPTPAPTSEPSKPMLICGDAKIDTSRIVVLHGYGDGELHENDPLTRAQLATIIYRLLDDESISKYDGGQSRFKDVPANAWYTRCVTTISNAGIVCGVGGSKYSPNSQVTWAQIIIVLTRFVKPQEYGLQHISYSGWANQAIQTAVALGWIEDSAKFQPNAVISRGELVELVNWVIERYR